MADVQASYMEKHRDWILTLLDSPNTPQASKVQRNRQPPIYTINMQLDWDIMGFVRYQEYNKEDHYSVISRTITLSGDGHNVQALPCQEYLKQLWPSTGPVLGNLLDELVRDPERVHYCKFFTLFYYRMQTKNNC